MKIIYLQSGRRHFIPTNSPPPSSADCIHLITYPFQQGSYSYSLFHPKNGITEENTIT